MRGIFCAAKVNFKFRRIKPLRLLLDRSDFKSLPIPVSFTLKMNEARVKKNVLLKSFINCRLAVSFMVGSFEVVLWKEINF